MKRLYPLSLLALFVVLMGGCGPSGTPSQDPSSTQTDDQSPQAKTTEKTNQSNQSGALKQRTGNPFQVVQPSQDTLPLLAIMMNLEQNLAALQAGIWRGDYQTINKAATALANHAKIPEREIKKIRAILGKEGLKGFVAADKTWHSKAKELARKAEAKKMEQIVNLTTEMVQRCASCHIKYREPLRNSPKWMNR